MNLKNHAKFLTVIAFSCVMIVYGNNILCAQTVLTTIQLEPEAGSGLGPVRVAVNPSTNRIYVSNQTTDNVSVIDGSNNQVVDTIQVGDSPGSIAVNSNTNMVYVAGHSDLGSSGGIVSVIDGSNNQVVDTIKVGDERLSIAVNPNTNMVYVTSLFFPAGIHHRAIAPIERVVSVIDGSNNVVVDTIRVTASRVTARAGELSTFSDGIAVNPNTNMVYVAGIERFFVTLSVIDGSNNQMVDTIRVRLGEGFINGIAVSPDTNIIYVTNHFSTTNRRAIPGAVVFGLMGVVTVIDGSNNRVMDITAIPE